MIVYIDVLIFLNVLVDYFLLLATAKITGSKSNTVRTVVSAIIGGLSSLYIFLPNQKTAIELLYKLLVAFVLSAIGFGVGSLKTYIKNTVVFFLVTCAYAGIMFAFWTIFKPYGMVINNSVVYFHISALKLVLITALGYVVFTVLWRIFSRNAPLAQRCEIMVFAEEKSIELRAILDTGNSIVDFFEDSEIIIADKRQVEGLFGDIDIEQNPILKRRFRLLPCSTVSGFDTLEGFRCDRAVVKEKNRRIEIKKPLLAVSKASFNEDYNAIVNPKILR